MTEVLVKATPVNGLATFVRGALTDSQLAQVLRRLPEGEARYFSGALLANELVPLSALNRLTQAAAATVGESVEHFARRAGRASAELGLRGVYKLIVAMLTPQAVLRAAPALLRRTYLGGEVSVDLNERRGAIRFRGFPAGPALCNRITGWFEVVCQRTGRGMAVVHGDCEARGAEACVWDVTWS